MAWIRSHPYASANWIRFIGLTPNRRLSASVSTPLRKRDYITSRIGLQVPKTRYPLSRGLPHHRPFLYARPGISSSKILYSVSAMPSAR